MGLTLKEIKEAVNTQKTIHDFSFLKCRKKHLEWLSKEVTDKVKSDVCTKKIKAYKQSWNKRENNRHRISTKMEYIVNVLCERLNDVHPLSAWIDNRSGPYFELGRKENRIIMPSICKFDIPKHYYKSFFHEIAHAVCDSHRLDIRMIGDKEEVLVENCSIIIGFSSGMNVWEDSISYIAEYCNKKSMKQDRYWSSIESNTYRILSYLLGIE
jgi:hypothetical protein